MPTGWRTVVIDGFEILVGKGARDNDELTLRVAEPHDLWLHAAGYAGSHVVVRNPDRLRALPRAVVQRAAELAAWHSKAQTARGKVAVHCCPAGAVRKRRGTPPGQVELREYETIRVYPRGAEGSEAE